MSNSFVTPWTVAYQAPLSMAFPPPGDLPDPGIGPGSPVLAGGFFTTEPPGKSLLLYRMGYMFLYQQENTGIDSNYKQLVAESHVTF